jgi:hypothetical protein
METPVKTIKAKGGSRIVQILRSTHSLLTTISEAKPKRMLAIKSKLGEIEGNLHVSS